jgi:thiol:disulfide interchange protein
MLSRKRFLLALLAGAACVQAGAQGLDAPFDARRDAAADVATAVAQAAAQGKHVIVDVGGQWCTWCHILDRFVTTQPQVRQRIAADFVWVKVNWSPANRNERVLSAWPKVAGYPHLFVLDANGRLLRSQPSAALESGNGYDAARMLAFLAESGPRR